MPMLKTVIAALDRSMARFEDFVDAVPEEALDRELPGVRSNTIGAQLWCVVGARESSARAIAAGAWVGFACSLDAAGARSAERVRGSLVSSRAEVLTVVAGFSELDDGRQRLLVDLLEHEAAHQGQLIRYLYALELPIAETWQTRWSIA